MLVRATSKSTEICIALKPMGDHMCLHGMAGRVEETMGGKEADGSFKKVKGWRKKAGSGGSEKASGSNRERLEEGFRMERKGNAERSDISLGCTGAHAQAQPQRSLLNWLFLIPHSFFKQLCIKGQFELGGNDKTQTLKQK